MFEPKEETNITVGEFVTAVGGLVIGLVWLGVMACVALPFIYVFLLFVIAFFSTLAGGV